MRCERLPNLFNRFLFGFQLRSLCRQLELQMKLPEKSQKYNPEQPAQQLSIRVLSIWASELLKNKCEGEPIQTRMNPEMAPNCGTSGRRCWRRLWRNGFPSHSIPTLCSPGLRGCSQFFNFDAPRNNSRVMTKKVVTRRVAHLSGIGIWTNWDFLERPDGAGYNLNGSWKIGMHKFICEGMAWKMVWQFI